MIKNFDITIELIVDAMRNQALEAHTSKAEVDISGGVDSAVVAALSCRAFGRENVIGVYSSINSSDSSRRLAKMVADKFKFHFIELDLSEAYRQITMQVMVSFWKAGLVCPNQGDVDSKKTYGGLRSCLRAPVGRFINRMFGGGIREGTGNRDEDELIRFYQKGGDGEVDSNWIEGLFKGEVWELAKHLGVPDEVINATPTPDLWGGEVHSDEKELEDITGVKLTYTRPGGPMGTIEWASRENSENDCIINQDLDLNVFGYDEKQLKIINAMRKLEKSSRHKGCMPPYICREVLIEKGAVE